MQKKILNIGILAHVDAGKTSLTENLLFAAGAINNLGSVDKGSTYTDFLQVEKERGITVQSGYANFDYKGVKFNLIDTPGHVDFAGEVERSLPVLDVAVLVISSVEGIQAHTVTLWRALNEREIPVFIFINKIDRIGSDSELILQEIEKEFSDSLAVLNRVKNEGEESVDIVSVWNSSNQHEKTIEILANSNEEILENYVDGNPISFQKLNDALKLEVGKASIYPVLLGSARNSIGINELLDSLISFIPIQKWDNTAPFSAIVFAITYEHAMGKMTYIKILSGVIKNRDLVFNQSIQKEEKVTQLRKKSSDNFYDEQIVYAGDVAVLGGMLDCKLGDVLGKQKVRIVNANMSIPLLTVQVKAINENNYSKLAQALQILTLENPALDFEWLKEDRELHIKIMGWMQLEVLKSMLLSRFNVEVEFADPSVIYKETPSSTGEGFVRYWMPKPCWAILKFKIEPGERGSGVQYISELSVDKVHRKYQNEVERTIPKALQQGIKGWEVTDIKISLVDGEDHEIHSRPGDFVIATPMGIMEGLKEIGTDFLEPYIEFTITAPEDFLGVVTSDIIQMRGSFDSPTIKDEKFILKGLLPLATSIKYPIKLSSRSAGRAQIRTAFHAYKRCNAEYGEIRDYKGISPLDTSKYILKARKALK